MIGDFLKKKAHLKKKGKSSGLGGEEYIDLTHLSEEGEKGDIFEADTVIKIAEIHRYEDVRDVTEEVYDGNILLVDIKAIAGSEESMERVQSELKAVASEVSGDVAKVGTDFIALTPEGIGIDRQKIKPF
ncbi:MAG: cell division protein SepF [Candidatus Thermoplasmatota archaeon]|nr:cell division protein SepF [Candidatus Thermoplasmatota archaeon]